MKFTNVGVPALAFATSVIDFCSAAAVSTVDTIPLTIENGLELTANGLLAVFSSKLSLEDAYASYIQGPDQVGLKFLDDFSDKNFDRDEAVLATIEELPDLTKVVGWLMDQFHVNENSAAGAEFILTTFRDRYRSDVGQLEDALRRLKGIYILLQAFVPSARAEAMIGRIDSLTSGMRMTVTSPGVIVAPEATTVDFRFPSTSTTVTRPSAGEYRELVGLVNRLLGMRNRLMKRFS
jgi:hypothetical protein